MTWLEIVISADNVWNIRKNYSQNSKKNKGLIILNNLQINMHFNLKIYLNSLCWTKKYLKIFATEIF